MSYDNPNYGKRISGREGVYRELIDDITAFSLWCSDAELRDIARDLIEHLRFHEISLARAASLLAEMEENCDHENH